MKEWKTAAAARADSSCDTSAVAPTAQSTANVGVAESTCAISANETVYAVCTYLKQNKFLFTANAH